MNLESLRLFCAIAAAGSFSQAARQLDVPKGTLSRRLAAFEAELGISLMNRSTRKVELTELGERLFRRSQGLVQELGEIGAELRREQAMPGGVISIRLPLDFFAPQFSEILLAFMQRFPGTSVHCRHYPEALPAYVDNDDLCFVWHESALPASEWIARPFMSLPQGLYAAPGAFSPASAAQLAEVPCITQAGERLWQFRAGAGTQSVAVGGRLQINSLNMRLQAARHGQGICKLPRFLGDEAAARGGLERLRLDREPVALSVTMLYRNRNIPAKVRAFIDFFQSGIGDTALS